MASVSFARYASAQVRALQTAGREVIIRKPETVSPVKSAISKMAKKNEAAKQPSVRKQTTAEKAYGVSLSKEQQLFVDYANKGANVLVEACVGSGKTTAIQALCELTNPDKSILYLTYNKLLKIDAKSKIKRRNTTVTNYHGWAWNEVVKKCHVKCSVSEIIQVYNSYLPPVDNYDLLVLDEYQDVEMEMSIMLNHIKSQNPNMQIVVVGDMAQKIYDKTRLNVPEFIDDFLGGDGNYIRMEFTRCFRLSADIADAIGGVWGKEIKGVNEHCEVKEVDFYEAFSMLSGMDPSEILCLGGNSRERSVMLNQLEEMLPRKFNKTTCWSNTAERSGACEPTPDCAIFTTYDGCKGMERKYCFVFDWTTSYWESRQQKPNVKYNIIRNIFCVAASRGKAGIYFVRPQNMNEDVRMLTPKMMMQDLTLRKDFETFDVSTMFEFKYIEDVEDAYHFLSVKEAQAPMSLIDIPMNDGLIDISMCIAQYLKAAYFENYDVTTDIKIAAQASGMQMQGDYYISRLSLSEKVLLLSAFQTGQNRYQTQVNKNFVAEDALGKICARVQTLLPKDSCVQLQSTLHCEDVKTKRRVTINGIADAVKNGVVYSLYFADEIAHSWVLQCAMNMLLLDLNVGRIWNVRTNQIMEIRIPDKKKFLDLAVKAASKSIIQEIQKIA